MSLWNFTIDDTSPYLSYIPYGDSPGQSDGWRTWYTESHFNAVPNQASRGDSYHTTSSKNANVTLQFLGTGIALFGLSNSSFDVIIDNNLHATIDRTIPITSDSLLYSTHNLTNERHSVTLSAKPSPNTTSMESIAFDFAITSTPLKEDENPPSPLFYDNSDKAALTYSGSWATVTQTGVPNATASSSFQKTVEVGASVSLSIIGANAVVAKGLIGSDSGTYSVTMDGDTRVFNGSSLWIVPDALLYFHAGLDPSLIHQLNITNLSGSLCLNSITAFKHEAINSSVSTTPYVPIKPSLGSNKLGTLIGSVLGCFALLVIIGFVIFFWLHRKPGRHHKQNGLSKYRGFKFPTILTLSIPEVKTEDCPPATISPMIATLNQSDRSVHDSCSAHDTRSVHAASDIHSTTNLLAAPSRFDHQSIRSNASSDANLFQGDHDRSSASPWPEHGRHYRISAIDSQTSYHHNTPSLVGSILSNGSWSSTPAPDYILMSPRKPLPVIPVPSYVTALQTPELTLADLSKDYETNMRFSALTAPPQYER